MRKYLITLAVMLTALLGAKAQTSPVGTWVYNFSKDNPTNIYGINFSQDGKMYCFSYNANSRQSFPVVMGDYTLTSDSTLYEHVIFHMHIPGQRDIDYTFHRDTDSTMVMHFKDVFPNGTTMINTDSLTRTSFDKMKGVFIPGDEASWQQTYQQALEVFGRKPTGSRTVESMGRMLYSDYQRFKENNQLDRAYEALLIRAEMDTTNLGWQNDVLDFYFETNTAPSMAEKIVNRIIRLKEQKAGSPTDTAVIKAYTMLYGLYSYRGNDAADDLRRVSDKALKLALSSDKTPGVIISNCYLMKSTTCLSTRDFEHMYEYAKKAAEILDTVPDAPSLQKAQTLFSVSSALLCMDKYAECLETMKQCVPLFADTLGYQSEKLTDEVYPFMFGCYSSLYIDNPKNKKLQKEYKEFISDKLLRAVIVGENPWGLNGRYYILERNEWNIESPYACPINSDFKRMLFEQDGKFTEVENPEGKPTHANLRIEKVDKDFRQQILNNWKNYRSTAK